MASRGSKAEGPTRSFNGVVLAGHKAHAIEVPFDPSEAWGVAATSFRPGRKGWPVQVVSKRFTFTSHVVARSKRFWLLLEDGALRQLKAELGDSIAVKLTPALRS